jgi:hypothetical protein
MEKPCENAWKDAVYVQGTSHAKCREFQGKKEQMVDDF